MKNTIQKTLFFLLLLSSGSLIGQVENSRNIWKNPGTDDFNAIRSKVEKHYTGKNKGQGSGYKPFKRWEWYMQGHLSTDGKITNVAAQNWDAYYKYQDEQKTVNGDAPMVTNGYWTSLGLSGSPGGSGWNPGIGRVNVIAFHPTDENTFWVGTPAGGLWKTANGGTTWTPLTDGMPCIGISGIAVDYTNPDVMYILSGDGDGHNTRSLGVFKTVNGGVTWYSTGLVFTLSSDVRAYKLIMHPTNSNILFVVASNGIWKTTDGAAIWSHPQFDFVFFDIEFKPGVPAIMYATTSNKFFRSTDTGATWNQISVPVPANTSRLAIGVTPANPFYVYLLTGPATGVGSFTGVYYSTNSGNTFLLRASTPNILGRAADGQDADDQADYDLAVAVSGTDYSTLVTGGINCWRSTDKGINFSIISQWNDYTGSQGIGYTHADIHDLAINPLNGWLYCCSDGGVYRSADFGDNWTDITSNLSVTEWFRIAGFEGNASLLIGGTQDNGSFKWTGPPATQNILGGDGMDCMIDPTNANVMYYESQQGGLVRSNNGGNTCTGIRPPNVGGPWVTPLVMNPVTTSTIYAGYDTIMKSTNSGSSWTMLLSGSPKGQNALAIGTAFPDRLYAAGDTIIWRSDDAGSNWTKVSAGLPRKYISRIAVNPNYSLEVYITIGGYTSGQKVYYSPDGGVHWTNMSGSLPNVPANCIAYEFNDNQPAAALYVGTDIGVFYKNLNMSDWIPYQNGLPTVPVFDLEINKTAGLIRAATFGRGLWTSALYSPCPANYVLTPVNDPGNPNYTGFQYYEANADIESSRTVTGGVGTNVTYKAGNNVVLKDGFQVLDGNVFNATIGSCSSAKSPVTVRPVTGTYAGTMKR